MPTGYTHAVQQGASFEEFAMGCARAFGATITMRDEPSDAEIPERFEPSPFYTERLAESEKELRRVQTLTVAQAQNEADDEYQRESDRYHERLAEAKVWRERYEAVLAKVRAWHPPSPDHVEMQEFMESQLVESIKFDCSTTYITPPEQKLGSEWLEARIKYLEADVERCRHEQQKEFERTEQRNTWIRLLRESLS